MVLKQHTLYLCGISVEATHTVTILYVQHTVDGVEVTRETQPLDMRLQYKRGDVFYDLCLKYIYLYIHRYRKVAGDKCIPGTEMYFFPIKHPCIIGKNCHAVRGAQYRIVKFELLGSGQRSQNYLQNGM